MNIADNTSPLIGQVIQHQSATGKIPFTVNAFDTTGCWIFGTWQSGSWSGLQGWVPIQLLTST